MQVIAPRSVAKIPESTHIAERLVVLDYAAIPAEVVANAKTLSLDTLAVAWAAQNAYGMQAALRVALADGGAERSNLWGSDHRVPPAAAAFYNSSLAAALDFDSLHENSGVHADAVVIPAAVAAAESVHADGRSFLAAYVAGAELMFCLGKATESTTGWFRTATYGVFGAAAAAGKLFGFDAEQLQSALGLALGQAAGTQQGHIERKLSKRVQSALSARGGVFAAQLAEQGISGPEHPFDGQFGLFALYDIGNPSGAFADLGSKFLLPLTVRKKFPSCGCTHAAIEADRY
jgi:2-methylcitrate dehydratase PrpD